MCGIAGIVRFDDCPIDTDRLVAMLASLRHRGPDGLGTTDLGRCALAHARLSILDLARGRQPMQFDDGTVAVVFNGEIYNHRDLRRQLEGLGHAFRSDHSDTEVLLHGYRQWGCDLPRHLEGMFAFAVWDGKARKLLLARDRTGKKPLYFWQRAGEIMFASLVATLLAGDDQRSTPPTDPSALLMFLRLGYTGDRPLLTGIEQLPPAHWLTVDADGTVTCQRYWQAPSPAPLEVPADPLQATHDALDHAVGLRLEADVPLGCFLSGGIDSSIIAALAQRRLAAAGDRLKTFSVKMPVANFDESTHARAVAEHIGSDYRELVADPSADVIADLTRLIATAGEPTADSSILPTYWLSRAARQHVKVALSGDGGDELFGGYDRYRALALLRRHRGWLQWVPTALLADARPRSTRTRLRRLVTAAKFADPARQYQSMVHIFNEQQIADLAPHLVDLIRPDDLAAKFAPAPDWPEHADPTVSARQWDLAHYLPMDPLAKVDRASMAVALEVRCPLLDTNVCELAQRLPTNVLMPGGRPKGLLRQLAATLVPPAIAERPKRGFAVPIGQWFSESLRQPLADRLFNGKLDALGLDSAAVRSYYDQHTSRRADHTHRLFALLELSLWADWLDAARHKGT